VEGGSVEALADANNGRGAAWGRNGVILFAPAGEGPLFRVPAGGGEAVQVTEIDSTRGEIGHRFPRFLPDGDHFLYVATPERENKFNVLVGSLKSKKGESLMAAEGAPVFVPPGHLVFIRNQMLAAQRFDPGRLELIGEPVSLGDVPSFSNFSGSANVSASTTGALAYVSGTLANSRLVWLDRSGRQVGAVPAPPARYGGMALSPDERLLAINRVTPQGSSDLWLLHLERGTASRFTFGPGTVDDPLWSPDGKWLVFSSNRNGPWDFYRKPVGGSGKEELLFQSRTVFKHPTSWSRDGRYLVFEALEASTGFDLWVLPMTGERTPTLYLRTPYNERFATLSPDGRWMLYSSDESGRPELYVQSFPTAEVKHQISTDGSVGGGWREDGKEILFGATDGVTLLSVDVTTAPEFHAGIPRPVGKLPNNLFGVAFTPDLRRILVLTPVSERSAATVNVVLDWTSGLPKR
jgi:Tol biopolymer transport system component